MDVDNQIARWLIIAVAMTLCTTTAGVGVVAGLDAQGEPNLSPYVSDNQVTPGSETTIEVDISNDGTFIDGNEADRSTVTTARGVVVRLRAPNSPISVNTNSVPLGEITEAGSPKTAAFDVTVPERVDPGTYDFRVTLEYSYTSKAQNVNSGVPITINQEESDTETETVPIRITDDARFEVTELDSTLRVGEEGEITGQLENIGRDDATNAEVSFAPESETVVALESNVAVGDIPAGESTQFSIPVEVLNDAEAVPKRFDLPVTFRDENGIRQSDDDPNFLVDVAGQRDTFLVEPVNSTIEAGGSRALDIEVTNNLDEPVSDIEGKLFADDPLDSANDETFTTSLNPGETTTVTVDLSAASGATIKNYPASMDFRYTDADGDSKLTDSYRLAVSVTEPTDDGGGLPVVPLLLVVLVVAGGAFLWRRKGGEIDDFGGLRDN
ncbi:COG1361 S-layer family protein [Halonotius sp. GCM10025705]|uniref:COG1361 S-layer family protein n=1 Tax=Halonotius sp. GCM10025705 TaxID=3252678 RepID=UPI0036191310